LFDFYQRATWLVSQRRYDEALAAYHAALGHDPSNVYIRLEIASVQEKLDLHLDALVTYDDVITICGQGRRRLARWWKVTPSPQRSSRRVRRQQDVALLVARYRHALVLGLGDALASTWWPTLPVAPVAGDVRVRHRATLRCAVRVRFARYLEPVVTGGGRRGAHLVTGVADDLLADNVVELSRSTSDSDARCRQRANRVGLRSYLCALSQYEIERLIADCRFIRLLHWIRWRRMSRVLPMNALRLCLVWILLRRAMADVDRRTGMVPRPPAGTARWRPRVPDLFVNDRWPPDPERLAKAVHTMSWFRSRHQRSWTACYNAACVYAVAMMAVGKRGAPDDRWRARSDEALRGDDRTKVACRAVNELYHATTASHSGWLAEHQSWLLEEDPDIDALRDHELFQVFEMVTFAPAGPRIRPRRAHVWEQVAYVSRLVHDIATYRADFWRARAHDEPPEDHTVAGWRAADRRAWADLHALAVSRQDWSSRNTAVVASRMWARQAGRLPLIFGFPPHRATTALAYCSYRDEPSTPLTTRDDVESAVLRYIDHCDRRLNELVRQAAALSQEGRRPIPGRPRSTCYRRECERRRRRWADLAARYDDHDRAPDLPG
jgi:hypothetical protein